MKQKYTKRASPLGAVHSHDNQPTIRLLYQLHIIAHEKKYTTGTTQQEDYFI